MTHNKTFTKSITINAPVSKVWHTLTDQESMNSWLADGEIKVSSEWKTGSPITFKGTWHGTVYNDKGIILKFEPEKIFRYTYWNSFSNLEDSPENYHQLEFVLTSNGNQTDLTLTCSNLINDVIYAHMNLYWTSTLDLLKKLIEK